MKFRYDVITVGGVTEDVFFTVDDYVFIDNKKDPLRQKLLAFEYGSKIGIPDISVAYGGGAANVAVALSRLGLRTSIIAEVGYESRGHNIIRNLLKNKVKCNLVEVTRQHQSGISYILVHTGHDHIIFTHRGANDILHIDSKRSQMLAKAEWVYVTSLTTSWKKILTSVFAKANFIAWNPGRQQLAAGLKVLKPFLSKTDLLILNKDEAIELVTSHNTESLNPVTTSQIKLLIKTIAPWIKGIVIITDGEKGATAFDGKQFFQQKIIKNKKVIDTTGVGDAFGASVVAGLKLYKGNIVSALELAAKNTSSVVGHQGAQNGLIRR